MLATCVTSADRHEPNGQTFTQLAFLNFEDRFLTLWACTDLFISTRFSCVCLQIFQVLEDFGCFLFAVLSEGLFSASAAFTTCRTAGPPHLYSVSFDFQSLLGEVVILTWTHLRTVQFFPSMLATVRLHPPRSGDSCCLNQSSSGWSDFSGVATWSWSDPDVVRYCF